MQGVYFTLVGIALYLLADWLLVRAETARGARSPQSGQGLGSPAWLMLCQSVNSPQCAQS